MKKMYVYSKFSQYDFIAFRLGGAGLGNLLFPWARSIVAQEKYNLTIISPTWPSVKIGPLIRSENDARHYIGMFKPLPNSINGIKKAYIMTRMKKYSEKMDINNLASRADNNLSGIIIFKGLKNYFEDILFDHIYVRENILKITREEYKKGLNFSFDGSVTLHIRLGDFVTTKQQTDLIWFEKIIKRLKEQISSKLKFYLFSDGDDKQLEPLTKLGNVERLDFGSSIADMLALSHSKVLIASRGSTFSMWGAYLGRMPLIQPYGGKRTYRIYDAEDAEKHILLEVGEIIPNEFLNIIKDKLLSN